MEDPFRHINPAKLPKHIAIIMDGNGRWAKQRNKPRTFGHSAGAETVKTIAEAVRKLHIPYLTLYTFSTENWNRPKDEVETLLHILAEKLDEERETLMNNQIQLNVVGDLSRFSQELQRKFKDIFDATAKNKKMVLSLALNYGGRKEILSAVEQILREKPTFASGNLTEEAFEPYLQSGDLPDVDLMIRTGGEYRISNFLLWKIAYAELYFTPVYWPDFGEKDLAEAIKDYQKRERRYGKTSEQIKNENQ